MRRLVLVVLLLMLWAPAAKAWTWPVQGPVLLGFTFDSAHPYAGGQHRGIDIGAGTGTAVVAPAGGVVTFAGTVPASGKSLTIATSDGYSVTLTHLGSIGVSRGAAVGEGDAIGTVGPSGTPELNVPYLYMGVRTTADAQGYLDPLSFLPALPPPTASAPTPPPPAADATATAPPETQTTGDAAATAPRRQAARPGRRCAARPAAMPARRRGRAGRRRLAGGTGRSGGACARRCGRHVGGRHGRHGPDACCSPVRFRAGRFCRRRRRDDGVRVDRRRVRVRSALDPRRPPSGDVPSRRPPAPPVAAPPPAPAAPALVVTPVVEDVPIDGVEPEPTAAAPDAASAPAHEPSPAAPAPAAAGSTTRSSSAPRPLGTAVALVPVCPVVPRPSLATPDVGVLRVGRHRGRAPAGDRAATGAQAAARGRTPRRSPPPQPRRSAPAFARPGTGRSSGERPRAPRPRGAARRPASSEAFV